MKDARTAWRTEEANQEDPRCRAPPPTTAARTGRREWLGLALPALLVALDIGVLLPALPHPSAILSVVWR